MNIEFIYTLKYTAIASEGIAAILSLILFHKYNKTPLKYIPIILWYSFSNELIGIFLLNSYNVILYNIYNIVFFLYFFYLFQHILQHKRTKLWAIYSGIIFLVAIITNLFYHNFLLESQLISYLIGAILLIICIVLFYIEIINSSKILYIKTNLFFWISTGLLLFYIGYIPIKLVRSFYELKDNLFLSLSLVQYLLIIIMNSCFIIGFLWMKKKL